MKPKKTASQTDVSRCQQEPSCHWRWHDIGIMCLRGGASMTLFKCSKCAKRFARNLDKSERE